jgi:hypothetical protein
VDKETVTMPTARKGMKEIRVVLDEKGEVYASLLAWAEKRRLCPGKAAGCILADWSDALSGKTNPFAVAIAAAAGVNIAPGSNQTTTEEPETSPEEQARRAALLEAAAQFL